MVRVGVNSTAGALLAVLVIKGRSASAVLSEHHMRALATSTSTSACATEAEACGADATCLACFEAYNAGLEGTCVEGTTLGTCDEAKDIVCCASSGCEDNAAFADFIGCYNSYPGCVIDITTCVGGSSGVITSDADTTTAGSTIATDGASSSTAPCPAEQQACLADPACLSCTEGMLAVEESCKGPNYDTETATCSERLEILCCYIDEVGVDCGNNALMGVWQGCEAADDGCDHNFPDCMGGGDATSTTADRGTTTADSTTAMDDTSATTSSACPVEEAACLADAECVSCAEAQSAVDLVEICQGPDFDVETATCSEVLEVGCCQIEEGRDCIATNAAMAAMMDCLAKDSTGCLDFSITDCIDGGDSSALVGGDDDTPAATTSDRDITTADSTTATDGGDGGGGDDEEDEEADGVDVEVDEEQADTDAADTDADSAATPSAMVGGTTATFVAAAVLLAFVNA